MACSPACRSMSATSMARTTIRAWRAMEERPLAIGAAALALGVVAGLMAPSTRKEDELMGETRDRLMERAKEVGEEALEKGKQVAKDTDEFVHEHPWKAVGVAAGVGLVVGMLIARR